MRAADKQTVNVALQVGMARVSLTSQPPGLPVALDGKPLDQVTPTEIQITSGPHTVVVTSAAGVTWTQDFNAGVDDRLAFNAPLGATRRQPATGTASRPAAATERPSPAPGPVGNAKDPARPRRPSPPRRDQVAEGEVHITEDEVEPPPPPPPAPKIEPPPPVIAEPIKPPAPPPVAPKGRGKPPVVAITAVTKLTGEIPVFKVNGITDNYADVVSKLCIDEAGRVTTATLIKALPEISDELRRTLLGWRYKPYVNAAGEPSAACFVLQFRMNFKHAS